ncbi:hypothetical protein GCK32_000154, partial [Trichostrongylus colubriformis]
MQEAVPADKRSFEEKILTEISATYSLLRKSQKQPQEGNTSAKRPTIDHHEKPEGESTLRNGRERDVGMRIDDTQDSEEQQEEGLIVLDGVSDDDEREIMHADDVANLEEQLKNTREMKLRAQQRVNEMRRERSTARRRFLPKKPQPGLPCVLCQAVEEHYSDACPTHWRAHARRSLVREDHRCEQKLARKLDLSEARGTQLLSTMTDGGQKFVGTWSGRHKKRSTTQSKTRGKKARDGNNKKKRREKEKRKGKEEEEEKKRKKEEKEVATYSSLDNLLDRLCDCDCD